MPLPPIAFYSIYEIAVRWGCHPADIAGWAVAGYLRVLAGIAPVKCGELIVAGLVEVSIAELMPMFRRHGPSEKLGRLKRVLPHGSDTWAHLTDPADGLPIRSSDLLLAAGPVQQFEEECDLLRRPASTIGASPRYDWDGMHVWLTCFIHENGVPESQAALIALVQDWFVENSRSGEAPDESTIRKRLAALWRRLRGDGTV